MQCRNALRRHVGHGISSSATTPSTLYQWTTDEQLSEAFARFVRVSKSNRRFGSNVPGPLEARRRQTRRRMGFVTGGTYQGTDLAEFGALFGAGEDRTGIYDWEPPTRDKAPSAGGAFGISLWSTPPRISWSSPPVQTWFDGPPKTSSPQLDSEKQQDRVEVSRSAFMDLLGHHSSGKKITAADVAPLLAFLESAQDEPGARNLDALLEWLKLQVIDITAFTAVRGVILSKRELRTISFHDFQNASLLLLNTFKDQVDADRRAAYLETLSLLSDHVKQMTAAKAYGKRELRSFYYQLVRSVAPPTPSFKSLAYSMEALSILSFKRDEIDLEGAFIPHAIKDTLMQLPLHRHNIDSTQYDNIKDAFVEILNTSQDPKLASAVMYHLLHEPSLQRDNERHDSRLRKLVVFWLRCLHRSDLLSSKETSRDILLRNWRVYWLVGKVFQPRHLAHHLQHLDSAQLAIALLVGWGGSWRRHTNLKSAEAQPHPISKWQNELVLTTLEQRLFHDFQYSEVPRMQDSLLTLLLTLKQHHRRPNRILADFFTVLGHGKCQTYRLYKLYQDIRQHKLELPVFLQEYLVKHLLQNGYTLRALHVLLESPELPLSSVSDLPDKLMIDCDPIYILWLMREKVSSANNQLPQNVIDLVVELASKTADVKRFTSTRAFNRVWRCYKFLSQDGVHMDASISKAMVRSGIIRALQDKTTLPNARLDYIVSIVRRYEGDEIADKLEHHAKAEREKHVLYKQPPKTFRPELGDLSYWNLKIMPRF